MKQSDADLLDELTEEYSTHADCCRHMAERTVSPLLAVAWTKLVEETKARSRANWLSGVAFQ